MLGKCIAVKLARWDVIILGRVRGEIMIGDIDRLVQFVFFAEYLECEHGWSVIVFRNPVWMLPDRCLVAHITYM